MIGLRKRSSGSWPSSAPSVATSSGSAVPASSGAVAEPVSGVRRRATARRRGRRATAVGTATVPSATTRRASAAAASSPRAFAIASETSSTTGDHRIERRLRGGALDRAGGFDGVPAIERDLRDRGEVVGGCSGRVGIGRRLLCVPGHQPGARELAGRARLHDRIGRVGPRALRGEPPSQVARRARVGPGGRTGRRRERRDLRRRARGRAPHRQLGAQPQLRHRRPGEQQLDLGELVGPEVAHRDQRQRSVLVDACLRRRRTDPRRDLDAHAGPGRQRQQRAVRRRGQPCGCDRRRQRGERVREVGLQPRDDECRQLRVVAVALGDRRPDQRRPAALVGCVRDRGLGGCDVAAIEGGERARGGRVAAAARERIERVDGAGRTRRDRDGGGRHRRDRRRSVASDRRERGDRSWHQDGRVGQRVLERRRRGPRVEPAAQRRAVRSQLAERDRRHGVRADVGRRATTRSTTPAASPATSPSPART